MKPLCIDADGLRDFVLTYSEFYLGYEYSNIGRYFVLSGQQSFTNIPIDIKTLVIRNYIIGNEGSIDFSIYSLHQLQSIVIMGNQSSDDNCKFLSFRSMNFIVEIYKSRSSPIKTD